METKLKEALCSKAETEAQNELMKEQNIVLKKKFDEAEEEAHKNVKELKDAFQKKVEEQRKDKEEQEETI